MKGHNIEQIFSGSDHPHSIKHFNSHSEGRDKNLASKNPISISLMASGSGTNVENILSHIRDHHADRFKISSIITDKKNAGVIERCQKFNINVTVIEKQSSDTKSSHEEKILNHLKTAKTDWILLAGFMRILSPAFIQEFWNPSRGYSQIINIHPSLLPSFKGKDAYEQAFQAGVKIHGATIHFVDEEVDHGPIILQKSYSVNNSMGLDEFKTSGLQNEYALYKDFLNEFATRKLVVDKNKRTWARFE